MTHNTRENRRAAAYRAAVQFVERNGGTADQIVEEGNAFYWTAPHGDVAKIGWAE